MPAPVVYIVPVVVIATAAAGLAFHRFVYEPHIAPKLEQWAEEFLAKRRARRRGPIPVANDQHSKSSNSKPSNPDDESDEGVPGNDIELHRLAAKEVREWRRTVNRSQIRGLRHRPTAGASSNVAETIASLPRSPTHVIFDPSLPSTPSSTIPSRRSSPSIHVSSLNRSSSQSTLRSPRSAADAGTLHSDPFTRPLSPGSVHTPLRSPNSIPSLSQSYPQDLDYELGLEFLSPPSSHPASPFSSSPSLSAQDAAQSNSVYQSVSSPNFTTSPFDRPTSDLDFLSDLDGMSGPPSASASDDVHAVDDDRIETSSSISGSSWASAGVGSH